MKKCLLGCFLLLLAWLIFSAFQPAIIIGESDNWKVVYKPRKGMDGVDTERYPWNGKIKWRHSFSEPQIESVDLWIDNKYVNELDRDAAKKGNGNFNGKVIEDPETFYNAQTIVSKACELHGKRMAKSRQNPLNSSGKNDYLFFRYFNDFK